MSNEVSAVNTPSTPNEPRIQWPLLANEGRAPEDDMRWFEKNPDRHYRARKTEKTEWGFSDEEGHRKWVHWIIVGKPTAMQTWQFCQIPVPSDLEPGDTDEVLSVRLETSGVTGIICD